MADPSGVLVVDKPLGVTSHGVVARARKALGIRRIGHAGTLDPQASGILVLGIGQATRILGYLSGVDKDYSSTFLLGISTSTDDADGDVIAAFDAAMITREDVESSLSPMRGEILQRPSAVSAIKVDGRRAYDRVRSGETVELPPRAVTVSALDLVGFEHVTVGTQHIVKVSVNVTCSSGTYIRAIARDLGESLGVGGHVTELRRTRSGAFGLADAVSLEDPDSWVMMTPAAAASACLASAEIGDDVAGLVRHGVQVPWPEAAPVGEDVALIHDGGLVAIARERRGRAALSAVFG